jgi:hypothetical protein
VSGQRGGRSIGVFQSKGGCFAIAREFLAAVAALSAVVLITSCSNDVADTTGTTAPQVTSAETSESTSAPVTSGGPDATTSETASAADETLPTLLPHPLRTIGL